MIEAHLDRTYLTETETRGVMWFQVNNHELPFLRLHTIEPPWQDNKPYESCIPEGVYQVEMSDSPKYGRALEIKGVPGRTDILFHVGNKVKDTAGCILPGLWAGKHHGEPMVFNSAQAISILNALFETRGFTLHIQEGIAK